MIENKLVTKLYTHQDQIDNGAFSLNLLNSNGIGIMNVFFT